MHVRLKRQKETHYVTINPSDSVLALKKKYATPLGLTPKNVRVMLANKTVLEDAQILEQIGVVNDQVLFVVHSLPNDDAKFEDVAVVNPPPLDAPQ